MCQNLLSWNKKFKIPYTSAASARWAGTPKCLPRTHVYQILVSISPSHIVSGSFQVVNGKWCHFFPFQPLSTSPKKRPRVMFLDSTYFVKSRAHDSSQNLSQRAPDPLWPLCHRRHHNRDTRRKDSLLPNSVSLLIPPWQQCCERPWHDEKSNFLPSAALFKQDTPPARHAAGKDTEA